MIEHKYKMQRELDTLQLRENTQGKTNLEGSPHPQEVATYWMAEKLTGLPRPEVFTSARQAGNSSSESRRAKAGAPVCTQVQAAEATGGMEHAEPCREGHRKWSPGLGSPRVHSGPTAGAERHCAHRTTPLTISAARARKKITVHQN